MITLDHYRKSILTKMCLVCQISFTSGWWLRWLSFSPPVCLPLMINSLLLLPLLPVPRLAASFIVVCQVSLTPATHDRSAKLHTTNFLSPENISQPINTTLTPLLRWSMISGEGHRRDPSTLTDTAVADKTNYCRSRDVGGDPLFSDPRIALFESYCKKQKSCDV